MQDSLTLELSKNSKEVCMISFVMHYDIITVLCYILVIQDTTHEDTNTKVHIKLKGTLEKGG